MVKMTDFKRDSEVNRAHPGGWYWKKDDTVWQYCEDALPEAYESSSKGGGMDFSKATAGEVVDYFTKSQNRGLSSHNTFVPSKLKSIKEGESKKAVVATGALRRRESMARN